VYEVIGHSKLREQQCRLNGSHALCGPSGVGRRGIAWGWAQNRPCEGLDLSRDAREKLREMAQHPDTVYIIELAGPASWVPLLRPLEEGQLTVVFLADQLPQPLRTRIPALSVGWLNEIEVTQILARDVARHNPRHLIARMAQGSMVDIHRLAAAAQTFETLDKVVFHRTADYKDYTPTALFWAIRSLCLSILGLVVLPFSDNVLSQIPQALAASFLRHPEPDPRNEHQARNLIQLFLGALRG